MRLRPERARAQLTTGLAVGAAGYAATGSLAGALLRVTAPSPAVLAGTGVPLALSALGWWGGVRRTGRSTRDADPVAGSGPVAGPSPVGAGPEGAAIGGRGDAEG